MSLVDVELGILEHKLHQAHKNAIQNELTAVDLQEIGHPLLLCILHSARNQCPQGQAQAQRELAALLNVSPAAVTTSLKALERKGYIQREPEQGDARRNRVRLTSKGEQAVESVFSVLQRVTRKMYAGFSTEEQVVMQGFYLRMLDNLQTKDT